MANREIEIKLNLTARPKRRGEWVIEIVFFSSPRPQYLLQPRPENLSVNVMKREGQTWNFSRDSLAYILLSSHGASNPRIHVPLGLKQKQ